MVMRSGPPDPGGNRIPDRRATRLRIHQIVTSHAVKKPLPLSPPRGRGRWTVRLLAQKLVEMGHVDSISHESVRTALKKTS